MRALLAKELRALRPFVFCIAGLYVLGIAFTFATEMPDQQKFVPAEWQADDRTGSFVGLALFGLMIGAGVLINESEHGTLRFLDGLPVSRTRLFVAKYLAALAITFLVTIIDLPSVILLDWISRASPDGPLAWNFLGAQVWLQAVAAAYLVALAMAFSFVRRWFALVIGLLFGGYLWLYERGVEKIALFNPRELLGAGFEQGRVLVPWSHVAAHVCATVVLLGIAWLGFLSLGDRAQFTAERLGKWRALRLLGTGLRLLAPVVWIAAMVRIFGSAGDDEAKLAAMPLGEAAFARRETARYEFLFRSSQREHAGPLLAAADQVHDAVAEFFGATPSPTRIVVDLASPVMSHVAGQTNWTKIRMPISPEQKLEEQRLILGHETTHVFIEQLSDGRLTRLFRYVRFFHEGLATHVEQQYFAEPEQRAQNHRSVAAAWARGRVPFEMLCDDNELRKKRDANLAYPLGEVFARALVETQERGAPAKLLRAFARKSAPSGLAGTALWRDTMQAAGLDFDRVVAAYESACATIAEEEKAFVEKLPRVSATVAVEGAEIIIRPTFDGEAPGELVCLVEGEDPLKIEMIDLSRRADGSFTLARQRVLKPTMRYLLGWHTPEMRFTAFEPWAEAGL